MAVQQWDGGYLPPTSEQRKIREYPREKPIDFSLWFQASLSFQVYAPAVCSAMHPSDELQEQAQRYWDATLMSQNLVSLPRFRRTVTLHVRRGDYVKGNHPKRYGVLSEAYVDTVVCVSSGASVRRPVVTATTVLDECDRKCVFLVSVSVLG